MLRGVPDIIGSDLLKALADTGHGDLIVIADHFYPPVTKSPNAISIQAKGNTAAEMVDAVLQLVPLDVEYEAHPIEYMVPDADSGVVLTENKVWDDTIAAVEPYMPKDKTRYLMGVGTPSNIIEGVARGVDFFDCVMPARNARHAKLFTWEGAINLKNAKYERDMQPIDPACDCPVCRRYSRAYLRHLFKAEEMLAMRLSVMHNLYFYNKLMERIRQALDEGRFEEFRRTYSERLDRRI